MSGKLTVEELTQLVGKACERVLRAARDEGHSIGRPRAGGRNYRSGEISLGAMRCRDEILAAISRAALTSARKAKTDE